MNRASISLAIKNLDEDSRLLEGWATRPEEDRVGDIVLPKGAIFKLPLPFLLDHDHRKAVGEVDRVEVTSKGIKFWAHIKKIAEPGEVKDMCDSAWALVRSGLRRSVSIGFRALDVEPRGRGLKIKSWEWLELSAVTVPALSSASITSIKDFSGQYVTVEPVIQARSADSTIQLVSLAKTDDSRLPDGSVRLIQR